MGHVFIDAFYRYCSFVVAGHNKWSQIKHRKGAQDSKRSKIFTKIIKEISVAVKHGGIDPQNNSRLRAALSWAKEANMPADNVQRALKKAAGADNQENYEEILYEGLAAGGAALIIECLTNNRNRTITSVRTAINKSNGQLASNNSCLYLFDRVAVFQIDCQQASEDQLLTIALDCGLLDIVKNEENFSVFIEYTFFKSLSDALEHAKIPVEKAEIVLHPKDKLWIEDIAVAKSLLETIEALEEQDDVQRVYGNFEFSDAVLEAMD